MSEPAISASGEYLYQRVLPLFQEDEKFGFFGRRLADAIMAMMQGVDQIILDSPTNPGWTTILDPAHCPAAWLPWCAQIFGVTLTPGTTVAQQRAKIEEVPPQKRGTLEDLEKSVRETLTGAKILNVRERTGGFAYRLFASTNPAETPNPAETLAALLAHKPAALLLTYVDGGTYLILEEADTTYAGIEAEHTKYEDVELEPEL